MELRQYVHLSMYLCLTRIGGHTNTGVKPEMKDVNTEQWLHCSWRLIAQEESGGVGGGLNPCYVHVTE